jgi:riboflavin kinase/FMN adenylyltransferase
VKIYKGYSDFKAARPVVTIGMFDGVHRGHISLIDRVLKRAGSIDGESVAVTFYPHPRIVLSSGDKSLRFLTSLDEKISLLDNAGLDHLIIIPFTEEFSRLSACDFVKDVLHDGIKTNNLVVGFDHQFGYRGKGTASTVGECAAKYGFNMERVEPYMVKGVPVSSSAIRDLIRSGDLANAKGLLGYDYFLKGRVVEGLRIGRAMGYPTANLKPDYDFKLIPASGVYAVEVEFENIFYQAMLYIGTRPTMEESDGKISIEAHLFNYDGDLYNRSISIHFRHRLRGDIKFANKDLLREQINKDKKDTLRILNA